MSANLDKSLDDLVGSRRQNARRRSNNRRVAAKPSVGGVKKSKPTKAAPKAAHPAPKAAPAVSSKIIVSGLVSSFILGFALNDPLTNFISLPMCLRPISRYVDREASWL